MPPYLSIKTIAVASAGILFVLVLLVFSTIASHVPQSRVNFSSLQKVSRSQSGCVVGPSSLCINMEFDCRFDIQWPTTELPEGVDAPLTIGQKLKLIYDEVTSHTFDVTGISSVSIPIQKLETCKLFANTKTTYNVIPGKPLKIATYEDQNGVPQSVYVVARLRD